MSVTEPPLVASMFCLHSPPAAAVGHGTESPDLQHSAGSVRRRYLPSHLCNKQTNGIS